MRVLVTRPDHAGRETASRLVELGHQPLLVPLSRPVHDTAAAEQAMQRPHAALVLTSAEATRAIAPLGDALAPYLSRPLFAVGAASAKAARGLGFRDIRIAAGEGESLADLVALTLADASAENPLLYLAGSPRSPRFEARLASQRVPLVVCECYRMESIVYDADDLAERLRRERPEAALFYSAEAARRFFALVTNPAFDVILRDMRFFCLSPNVLAAIPSPFVARAEASATPEEASLLALISSNPGKIA
ncbi:uroporphyrinogen-III synthase [Rhizobium sp. RU36D]|uniref:uroporphyrinogen-III synthase n=1 Tax=Rhizobium sp. RU36D TaxID=1907415 RepID=UPI0009D87986|nr:uroporphyrinogen-III synthase [Rhizobium sp. RU36D]SMC76991.1 uroporphyrinogen-III synthase [Rhizobium sp. RU36D]